mmetsp:Transcript_19670/g.25923  ORF Transcript_19670/g.25923 Transcript_19670/m.25923 type:complete len:305 (-) Transcript_19670:386-1300(-)
MLNYEYELADQHDQFPSIDPNSNDERVCKNSNRMFDAIEYVKAKCTELKRKPVYLFSFIVTIQMLWIVGLTVQVNSSSCAQSIKDLQMSLQKNQEPSLQPNEVRIGSEATDDIRIMGKKIWFEDSKEIDINEVPTTSSREWSQSDLQITVGTKITWTWTSNENLVEASENYAVKSSPAFSSGAIRHGGTLSYIFETPGTFFFVSENTASMRGKVSVIGSYIEDGSLSVSNLSVGGDLSVGGSFSAGTIPGTIHSYQIARNSPSYVTCPTGTSAISATTGTSSYSSSYFHNSYNGTARQFGLNFL